jgi:hypothetical protein
MKSSAIEHPASVDVVEAVRARAQAEWVEWNLIAAHVDGEEARVEAGDDPPLIKPVVLSAIRLDLAAELHWSEGQVSHRAVHASRVRDHTPVVWAAFREGRIDGWKAREIAGAIDKLERPESIARLDSLVVAYAESHTVAELRRWLKVFIERVEADLIAERAEKERADRKVVIEHGDNGMAMLFAQHTSLALAAIDKRLTKEAKAFGADDPRTLDQRRADLLAAWLTTNEAGEPAINADIAVTMPGYAVAGSEEAPAIAADGSGGTPCT